jgi:hypothetical protein
VRGQAPLQLGLQPLEALLVQAASLPAGALGGQRLDATGCQMRYQRLADIRLTWNRRATSGAGTP